MLDALYDNETGYKTREIYHDEIEHAYLDYFNNYLTLKSFAIDYDITEQTAERIRNYFN